MATWNLEDSLKIARFLTKKANGSETKLKVADVCEEYIQKRGLNNSVKDVLQQQFNRVLDGLQDFETIGFNEKIWMSHIYDIPIRQRFCNLIFSQNWLPKVTLSENAVAVKLNGSYVKLNIWKWGGIQNEGFDHLNQPSSSADHDEFDETSLWDQKGPDIERWKYFKPSKDTSENTTWTPQQTKKFMDTIVERTKTAPLFLTFDVFCEWFKNSEKVLEDVATIKQRMLKIIQKPVDTSQMARFLTKIKTCQVMRIPADDDFKIQLLNYGIVSFDDESCILDFVSYDGSLELGDEYVNRIHLFLYEEAAANFQTTITEEKLIQSFLKQKERFKWGAYPDEYLTKKFGETLVGIHSLDKYGAPGQIRLMIAVDPEVNKLLVKENKCMKIRGYNSQKRTLFRLTEDDKAGDQVPKKPEKKRAKRVETQEEKSSGSIDGVIKPVAKASPLRCVMASRGAKNNKSYKENEDASFFVKLIDLVTQKDQNAPVPSRYHYKPKDSIGTTETPKDRSLSPSENLMEVWIPKDSHGNKFLLNRTNDDNQLDLDDKPLEVDQPEKPGKQDAAFDPTPDEFQGLTADNKAQNENTPTPQTSNPSPISIKELEVRPFPRYLPPQRTENTITVHELMEILNIAILTLDSPVLSDIIGSVKEMLGDEGNHEKMVFINRIGSVLNSVIQSIVDEKCEVGHCEQPLSLSTVLYGLTIIVMKINSPILLKANDLVLTEKKKYAFSDYTVCAETITRNVQKIFNVFKRHNISTKILYHAQFDL